jgi:uncharacterized SAM-binding protein YcdF (DUF218 family)
MFFVASKVLWLVVEPLNLILLIVAAAAIAAWRGKARGARALITIAALGMLAPLVLPLDLALLIPLEQRFPILHALPQKVDGVVLLGGAQKPVLTQYFKQPELNAQAETMTTFLALARRYPEAKLVFTGGNGDIRHQEISEAATVRMFLRQQGFDDAKVLYETQSRNTYENAVFAKRLAQPQPGQTWLVIVSARSVPRAIGVFRKTGWQVIPVPCDYRVIPEFDFYPNLNVLSAFDDLSQGLREWIGLLAYYATGKTDVLFPKP